MVFIFSIHINGYCQGGDSILLTQQVFLIESLSIFFPFHAVYPFSLMVKDDLIRPVQFRNGSNRAALIGTQKQGLSTDLPV